MKNQNNHIVDAYLECLDEGRIWDKTKELAKKAGKFVDKHKGKIAVGLAAGVAAKGAHSVYNNPKRVEARKRKKAAEIKKRNKIVADLRTKDSKGSVAGGVAYATGKTALKAADYYTRPARWAIKKGLNLVAKGAKGASKFAGRKTKEVAKDTYNRIKYRKYI